MINNTQLLEEHKKIDEQISLEISNDNDNVDSLPSITYNELSILPKPKSNNQTMNLKSIWF